jgi:hypothetical protein
VTAGYEGAEQSFTCLSSASVSFVGARFGFRTSRDRPVSGPLPGRKGPVPHPSTYRVQFLGLGSGILANVCSSTPCILPIVLLQYNPT